MHWDIFEPLTFNGYPTLEQLEKGEKMAMELAKQVKEIPSKINDENY